MTRRGLHGVDVAEDRGEVGLGGEVELVGEGTGALGAQPHLASRLLGADVEHALAVGGSAGRDLEQQRRLADAGLAAEQDGGAGHDAAAEHAVELGDAGRPVRRRLGADLGDRPGGAPLGDAGRGDRDDGPAALDDAAPDLAFGAAAVPLGARPPALAARVRGCARLGHAVSLGGAADAGSGPGRRNQSFESCTGWP